MLHDIANDIVTIEKPDGTQIGGVKAHVQPDLVIIPDATVPLEEGDLIVRRLRSGTNEIFEVVDRGFLSTGGRGIEDHYQAKVRRRKRAVAPAITETAAGENTKPKVFIVHGHDMATLNRLELILHRIGAEPITLRKAPKAGSMTLIELLEEYLPTADAVVVLMTPDDEGRNVDSDEPLGPRVRENVLLEAGYAVINNRKRSLLIAIGGVSIPSDFAGIARIQSKTWAKVAETELAKRLSDMGLSVAVGEAI